MSKKRKPRSVWVWMMTTGNVDCTMGVMTRKPPEDTLFVSPPFAGKCGYVEARIVLPKKRRAVKRGK